MTRFQPPGDEVITEYSDPYVEYLRTLPEFDMPSRVLSLAEDARDAQRYPPAAFSPHTSINTRFAVAGSSSQLQTPYLCTHHGDSKYAGPEDCASVPVVHVCGALVVSSPPCLEGPDA